MTIKSYFRSGCVRFIEVSATYESVQANVWDLHYLYAKTEESALN